MSEVKTQTVWRTVNAEWLDSDPEQDTLIVSLQSEGALYAVVCSGPKNMKSNEIISAMRAATGALINATGGDMRAVGVSVLDGSQFDTGNQRAN